jgi:hypothetical protein
MKWRRGLLFALIHICIAVPLIVWQEARDWCYLTNRVCASDLPPHIDLAPPKPPPNLVPQLSRPLPVPPSQEEVVGFDPLSIYYVLPPQVKILKIIDLPAWAVAQWHEPFHSRCSLAGVVEAHFRAKPRHQADIIVSLGFTILIFVQWLVLGAIPLSGLKEPLVMITACGVVAALALPVPLVGVLAGGAILIAGLMWLLWLGVFLVQAVKAGWRRLRMRFA